MKKAKSLLRSTLRILLPLFSFLFLATATMITILYMQGYTIDFNHRELIKTGVLNIESKPKKATIYLNGEKIGNSNKVISNAEVGTYQIRIEKDGYFSYEREVPVLHAMATLIDAQLLYTNPPESDTFLIKKEDTKLVTTADHHAVLAVSLERPQNADAATTSLSLSLYEFSRQLFDPPHIEERSIASVDLSNTSATSIDNVTITADSQLLHILVTVGDKSILINTKDQKQSINWESARSVPLTQNILAKDTIVWGKHSGIVVVETARNVIAFNIQTNIKTIIYEKSSVEKKLAFTTTKEHLVVVGGQTLKVIPLTGGTAIAEIPLPFLAVEEDQTAPQVLAVTAHVDDLVFVVSTDKGSYLIGDLYPKTNGLSIRPTTSQLNNAVTIHKIDITASNEQYSWMQVSETAVSDIHLSDDEPFLSFVQTNEGSQSLYLFTYNKQEPDMVTVLGATELYTSNAKNLVFYNWVMNDNYFMLQEGSSLKYVAFYGNNIFTLLDDVGSTVLWFKDPKYLLYQKADQPNQQRSTFSFIELYD